MKHVLKFLIIIIVGVVTYFMHGCSTVKPSPESIRPDIVMPAVTGKVMLDYYDQYVNDGYICIASKDKAKQIGNAYKLEKYLDDLINENNALREIIKNKL